MLRIKNLARKWLECFNFDSLIDFSEFSHFDFLKIYNYLTAIGLGEL